MNRAKAIQSSLQPNVMSMFAIAGNQEHQLSLDVGHPQVREPVEYSTSDELPERPRREKNASSVMIVRIDANPGGL